MILKRNKRAVSEVVASVLIILITVGAAAILATLIKPFVTENLNKSSECLSYQTYVEFEEEVNGNNYNCWQDAGAGDYFVGATIKTGAGLSDEQMDELKGFTLVFMSDTSSENVELYEGRAYKNKILGDVWLYKEQVFRLLEPRETLTYVYNSKDKPSKIEVYPLLKSGRVCEKADEITVLKCSSGVILNG